MDNYQWLESLQRNARRATEGAKQMRMLSNTELFKLADMYLSLGKPEKAAAILDRLLEDHKASEWQQVAASSATEATK